ncbi:MAG TPA: PEGA domain-containing protein [Polyangiaceae bacterium]|nr:PEGA domain-containing protein [Polyangiaceae bacterium]
MPTPRSFSTLATAMVLAASLATPELHAADPDVRAREYYDRAVELYGQRDYAAALEQLRRASELRPHYRLQRALAQVHAAMRDYAAAYTANRLYLEQGADKVTAERREEVVAEMTKLQRLVALVTLAVDVPGALIRIDDANVGQAPIAAPIALNVGPHQVLVSHPSYPDQSRAITAVAGASEQLEFSLARRSSAAAAPAGSARDEGAHPPLALAAPTARDDERLAPAPTAADPGSNSYVWIGWVATGALAAGATATGVWALSKNSSLDDERQAAVGQGNIDRDRLDSRASSLRVLATVTDVLWVATAAAAGVTLWLTLDPPGSSSPSTEPALQAGLTPGGVRLRAKF